jgi:trigger factor
VFADVRRGKALASVVERATVTDTDGNAVDTSELFGGRSDDDAEGVVEGAAEAVEAEGDDEK